jgi:methyltransferase-like protein
VAYVSYAAYPGWHLFGVVRDLLRYATRGETEPRARARAALALLDRLAESVPDERSVPGRVLAFFAGFLKQRMDELGEGREAYILHDTLAEVHQPLYLHEFVERAAAHGLHYLTDADLSITLLGDLPPSLRAAVRALGAGVIEQEQFLDFFRGRAFHKTLLTRQPGRLDREAMLARLTMLSVSSPARPVEAAAPDGPPRGERFVTADGAAGITFDQPLSRAAMRVLIERWPAAVAFPDLLAEARRLAGVADADGRALADDLLRGFCVSPRLVGLHVHPPRPATTAGPRPLASPVARYQARFGNEVTNLYHEGVTLDGFRHCLLGLLDGTRDRAALLAELERLAAAGRLSLYQRGAPVTEPAAVAALLRRWLEPSLAALARAALLVE